MMGASLIVQRPQVPDFGSLHLAVPAVPIPGLNTGREAQYARRVRELEEELRAVRAENEKNVSPALAPRQRNRKQLTFVFADPTESHDCQIP